MDPVEQIIYTVIPDVGGFLHCAFDSSEYVGISFFVLLGMSLGLGFLRSIFNTDF